MAEELTERIVVFGEELRLDPPLPDLLVAAQGHLEELRARWGDAVFSDGEVDRAAVGRIVFADRDELAWLEGELHPRVRRAYAAWIAEVRAEPDPPALVVVEIPLLYETGGEERFDKVVVITASEPVRAARRDAFADRESRLIPDEEKVRRADFAYLNDGTLTELDAFVAHVVEVTVNDGTIKVDRVVTAVDCGIAVTPDVVRAQMQSCIGYGLSAALYGKISLTAGRVDQTNFHQYRVLRFNEMPRAIEIHIVPSTNPPTGVGEPGTPPIAPAVANAVRAATGIKLHKLPFDLAAARVTQT